MALRLVVEIGGDSVSEFEYLFEEGQITLGRNPACLVQIPLDSVSDKHLSFVNEGGTWLVADRGSTNGTRHNGTLLEPDRFRPLKAGDELRIVDVVIRVDIGANGRATSAERSGELARRMVERLVALSPADSSTQAFLEVLSGRDIGEKRALAAHSATRVLGPGDESPRGWRLSDPAVLGPVVFEPSGSGFRVTGPDVTVNGEPVPAGGAAIKSGARVGVGATVLLFFDPLDSKLRAESRSSPRKRPTRPSLAQVVGEERRDTAQVVTVDRAQVIRTSIGLPLQGDRDVELAHTTSTSDPEADSPRDGWGILEIALLGLAVILFLGAVGVFLLLFGFL